MRLRRSLTSHSGLALIGALRTHALGRRVDEILLPERPCPEVSHGDVMTSMIGLLALGKPDFEAVEAFRTDPFFAQAWAWMRCRPATLRSGSMAWAHSIREESADMVARHAPPIMSPTGATVPGSRWISTCLDNSHTCRGPTRRSTALPRFRLPGPAARREAVSTPRKDDFIQTLAGWRAASGRDDRHLQLAGQAMRSESKQTWLDRSPGRAHLSAGRSSPARVSATIRPTVRRCIPEIEVQTEPDGAAGASALSRATTPS